MSSELDGCVVVESTTLEEVRQSVKEYPDYAPESLKDLDPFRYDNLPKTLRKRREDNKSAISLTRDEVVKLVEWKLFVSLRRRQFRKVTDSRIANMASSDRI